MTTRRSRTPKAPVDPEAPHGRDEDGVPLAPYGYKVDGSPRKSNRGAAPGQRGNGGPTVAETGAGGPPVMSKVDKQRRSALLGLLESCVTLPLVGAAMSPWVERRIGQKQAMAVAGDAVIIATYAPALADGLVMAAQAKPALLSWLDTIEDKAPFIMLAQAGLQVAKALVGNHVEPDPRLAQAGVTLARVRALQFAAQIEQEAAAMGIPTSVPIPDDEDQAEAA